MMQKDIQKEFLENRDKNKDVWRIFRVVSEFTDAFEELDELGPAVSIFGSSRMKKDDPYYSKTVEIAEKLSRAGYAIITGGGPGAMEAANKGALKANGISIGLNITLPHEQEMNRYVNLPLHFRYFFTRKVTFMKYAVAFVVMPGGLGTMDELFEGLVLKQTGKIGAFPLVLFGSEFWKPFVALMEELKKRDYISESDMLLYKITDDTDEVVEFIKQESVNPTPERKP